MTDITFDAETVAVLCCAILDSNKTLGSYYQLMSAIDGTRTASSYEHKFRPVLKRAREIKAEKDKGAKLQPVPPQPKKTTPRSALKKTTVSTGSKRGRPALRYTLAYAMLTFGRSFATEQGGECCGRA